MSESESRRPQQVTLGGGLAVGASVLLIASIFDALANLRSIDRQEALAKALSHGRGATLGIDVDQATSLLHALLLISGAAAAIVMVLGVFALQRNNRARIVLSVLAIFLALAGTVSDAFFGIMVAVGAALLWSGPARDWFAGRPVRQPVLPNPTERSTPASKPETWAAPTTPEPQQTSSQVPPPHVGYGQPAPVGLPGDYSTHSTHSTQPGRPPAPVRAAALITIVASALVACLYALMLTVLAAAPDELLNELMKNSQVQDLGVSRSALLGAMWVGGFISLGWAILAVALAVLVWRRHNWARLALVACAVLTAVFCLLAFPFSLLHLVACAVTTGLLLSAPSRVWFTSKTPTQGPPASGPPASPPQPPTRTADGKPPVW